jgi:hypothetical protein
MLYPVSYRAGKKARPGLEPGTLRLECSFSCIRRRPIDAGDKSGERRLNPVSRTQTGIRTRHAKALYHVLSPAFASSDFRGREEMMERMRRIELRSPDRRSGAQPIGHIR